MKKFVFAVGVVLSPFTFSAMADNVTGYIIDKECSEKKAMLGK